jgi:hypothetical protein
MLFRETVAVYCENHTEHTHTVGRMQSFSMLKQVVHIVTAWISRANWFEHFTWYGKILLNLKSLICMYNIYTKHCFVSTYILQVAITTCMQDFSSVVRYSYPFLMKIGSSQQMLLEATFPFIFLVSFTSFQRFSVCYIQTNVDCYCEAYGLCFSFILQISFGEHRKLLSTHLKFAVCYIFQTDIISDRYIIRTPQELVLLTVS